MSRVRAFARSSWILVAACVLAVGLGAALAAAKRPPTYEASAQLFVSTGNEPTSTAAYAGLEFSMQATASYAILITSDDSVSRALQSIGSTESAQDVASRLTVATVPDTVMLTISIEDANADHAAVLVNAIANSFQEFATEVDSPNDKFQNLIRVSVVSSAEPAATPMSNNVARNGLIGAALGLVLGLGLVRARRVLSRAKPSGDAASDAHRFSVEDAESEILVHQPNLVMTEDNDQTGPARHAKPSPPKDT